MTIFIYPFIDLYFLAKSVSVLEEFSPELDTVFKNMSTNSPPTIKQVLRTLLPSNMKVSISSPETYTKYRRAFFTFVEYFISGIILLILDILVFILSIKILSDDKLIYVVTLSIINLFPLWTLKLSSIFHLLGLKKLARTLDNISFELLSPKGRFNIFIYNIAIKTATYFLGLITFFIYYKLANSLVKNFIQIDFIIIFLELIVYQYFINKLLAFFLALISKKSTFLMHHQYPSRYYLEILKNTTYIVFLSLYILYKYVQLLSGDSSYNSSLIESIGALFLLDTYFDKTKNINDTSVNRRTDSIKQIELKEEIELEKSNLQSTEN